MYLFLSFHKFQYIFLIGKINITPLSFIKQHELYKRHLDVPGQKIKNKIKRIREIKEEKSQHVEALEPFLYFYLDFFCGGHIIINFIREDCISPAIL
jgi:hypothetical protein